MINKISGKRSPTEVKHLQVGDKEIAAVADIADTLAESFSEISSNKHYSSKFQSHKKMLNVKLSNLIHTIWKHTTLLSL